MINQYLEVFDQNQIDTIWEYLKAQNWVFWHKSNPDSKNFFWNLDLNNYSFFTEKLFLRIKELIGEEYYIERVYANGQTFGLDGEFHIDSNNPNAFTFLYYPMVEWDLSWGGETIILEPDGTALNVYPNPNSAIMFPANWMHCGKSPSKSFTDLRITIAYKLVKYNEPN